MVNSLRTVRAVAVLLATLLLATPAFAQGSRPAPVFRGLFGPNAPEAPRSQTLDVTIDVYEEYDNNLQAALHDTPVIDSAIEANGVFSGFRSDVSYLKRGPSGSIRLQTEGNLRYYPNVHRYVSVGYRGDLGFSVALGRLKRTTVQARQTFEYAPYFMLPVFNRLSLSSLGDAAGWNGHRYDVLARWQTYTYNTLASLDRVLTPKSSIAFDSNLRRVRFTTNRSLDVRDLNAGGRFSRQISRFASLRLGYRYQQGHFGAVSAATLFETHNVDIGIDYSRPLTRSRKTTFSFGSGSALIAIGPYRHQALIGHANLRHEMGRAWNAEFQFTRGIEAVETFGGPVLSNTVTTRLGGYLGRRVEVSAASGYSIGDLGFARKPYSLLQGIAQVRVALGRYVAIDTQGLYFRYFLTGALVGLNGLMPQIDRYAVRTNLTFWLPILH